jgi:hypothetical protein
VSAKEIGRIGDLPDPHDVEPLLGLAEYLFVQVDLVEKGDPGCVGEVVMRQFRDELGLRDHVLAVVAFCPVLPSPDEERPAFASASAGSRSPAMMASVRAS